MFSAVVMIILPLLQGPSWTGYGPLIIGRPLPQGLAVRCFRPSSAREVLQLFADFGRIPALSEVSTDDGELRGLQGYEIMLWSGPDTSALVRARSCALTLNDRLILARLFDDTLVALATFYPDQVANSELDRGWCIFAQVIAEAYGVTLGGCRGAYRPISPLRLAGRRYGGDSLAWWRADVRLGIQEMTISGAESLGVLLPRPLRGALIPFVTLEDMRLRARVSDKIRRAPLSTTDTLGLLLDRVFGAPGQTSLLGIKVGSILQSAVPERPGMRCVDPGPQAISLVEAGQQLRDRARNAADVRFDERRFVARVFPRVRQCEISGLSPVPVNVLLVADTVRRVWIALDVFDFRWFTSTTRLVDRLTARQHASASIVQTVADYGRRTQDYSWTACDGRCTIHVVDGAPRKDLALGDPAFGRRVDSLLSVEIRQLTAQRDSLRARVRP